MFMPQDNNGWLQQALNAKGETQYGGRAKNPFQNPKLLELLQFMKILDSYKYNNEAIQRDALEGKIPSEGLVAAANLKKDQLHQPLGFENGRSYRANDGDFTNMIKVDKGQDPRQDEAIKFKEYYDSIKDEPTFAERILSMFGR